MRRLRNAVLPGDLVHRNVAKRVEEFDRQLKLFLEELAHVRSAGARAAKKGALRGSPLLLRTVMTDRAHQLGMQARHRAAHNLGNSRNVRIRRFGVSPSQTNKSVAAL